MTEAQHRYQTLKQKGIPAVLFEGGWFGCWSFVVEIDAGVEPLRGEEGLAEIRRAVVTHREKMQSASLNDEAPFSEGYVGFLEYEFGERWVDVSPGAAESEGGSALFYKTKKVHAFRTELSPSPSATVTTSAGESPPVAPPPSYQKAFAAVQEALYSGESYQVNYSEEFIEPYAGDPFDLYCHLAKLNPSSHQCYFPLFSLPHDGPSTESTPTLGSALISNSPELLFTLQANGKFTSRPIKGTAPRFGDPLLDRQAAEALVKSNKDAAELMMIVDLVRNDMGKVARTGSVVVEKHRELESYSNVFHTVSTITAQLRPELDWYDALRALFPGGSVTGCPKKRTMELIRELERGRRSAYCGSAGLIDLSGAAEFNILIRTATYLPNKKELVFRSGGGLVVDSTLEAEYAELCDKAEVVRSALGSAN